LSLKIKIGDHIPPPGKNNLIQGSKRGESGISSDNRHRPLSQKDLTLGEGGRRNPPKWGRSKQGTKYSQIGALNRTNRLLYGSSGKEGGENAEKVTMRNLNPVSRVVKSPIQANFKLVEISLLRGVRGNK